MNNPANNVNKSEPDADTVLRRQLDQARREVSQSMAMRLVHIRDVPIKNTDRATLTIADFEARLNGGIAEE